jgi:hypothetical protein
VLEEQSFTVRRTASTWTSSTLRTSIDDVAHLTMRVRVRATEDSPLGDRHVTLRFPGTGLLQGLDAGVLPCVRAGDGYEKRKVRATDLETFAVTVKVIEGTMIERAALGTARLLGITLGVVFGLVLLLVVGASLAEAVKKRRS